METPQKFKKKPIVIEAIQYIRANMGAVSSFIGDFPHKCYPTENLIVITTLEGEHLVREGDYVIKGAYEEFYPCKPDIFKGTYDVFES
jgi:hypothetical protein